MAANISIASDHVSDLDTEHASMEGNSEVATEGYGAPVVATKLKNATKSFPTSGDSLWQLECFKQPAIGQYRKMYFQKKTI